MERIYLDVVARELGKRPASVFDLGCGTGEPIARYFIELGYRLTGVDPATEMLEIARERFPDQEWLLQDMRQLALGHRFDALIAWNSFFHLPASDQRAMFEIFADHSAPGALLLFTAGPAAGQATGDMFGHTLFHESLDAEEYEELLGQHGFRILRHRTEDPECGGHTVWLARRGDAET